MVNPDIHAGLGAWKQSLAVLRNYLEMVVQPEEELLQKAMREYAESWEVSLPRKTKIAA